MCRSERIAWASYYMPETSFHRVMLLEPTGANLLRSGESKRRPGGISLKGAREAGLGWYRVLQSLEDTPSYPAESSGKLPALGPEYFDTKLAMADGIVYPQYFALGILTWSILPGPSVNTKSRFPVVRPAGNPDARTSAQC